MATSPNTIISYPDAAQPLDGTEAYAAWQNGGQKQVTGFQLAAYLLAGIGTPTDSSAVAAALSQQLAAFAASQAAVAAAIQSALPTSVADGGSLPFEVTALSGGIGTGAGGTPGIYALGVVGGPAGFQASVTIGADGKIAGYAIVNPGISASNSAPVLSLATVPGLTGATLPTATVSTIPNGRVFSAPSSDGTQILAWGNNGGTLASAPFGGVQLSLPSVALVEAWAQSPTNPDPSDPASKSAKTWSLQAASDAAAINAKLIAISNPDGTTGFAIGWPDGDVFKAHTYFEDADGCPIRNTYLDGINITASDASVRAPASYLTGPLQHRFMVGIPSADGKSASVLFGVRADAKIDNSYFSGLYTEVLASQDAPKQQLMPRGNALGFWQYGFRKALRAALRGGVANVILVGDSLTTNLIAVTLYRLFGYGGLGFGGMGMLPFAALGLGYQGTSGAMAITAGNWNFWTYNPTASPTPPAGTTGWDHCWIKSAGYAVAGNGMASIYVNALFSGLKEYAFDTVRVFYHSTGGDCAFHARANGTTADAWTSATATSTVQYVDIPNFGAATGRFRLDIEEQIVGGGTLYIGGLCFINSAGGIRFHRQSLGGYKAGDVSGQDAASQAIYYAAIGVDMAHVNMAHNDSGTDDAVYAANMQTIISRLRAQNPVSSLVLTQWFSAAALKREAEIKALALANDGTVFDVRDVIPTRDFANAHNILLSPGTADDPHLVDDGYEYVGHSLALQLGLNTAIYPLHT